VIVVGVVLSPTPEAGGLGLEQPKFDHQPVGDTSAIE